MFGFVDVVVGFFLFVVVVVDFFYNEVKDFMYILFGFFGIFCSFFCWFVCS